MFGGAQPPLALGFFTVDQGALFDWDTPPPARPRHRTTREARFHTLPGPPHVLGVLRSGAGRRARRRRSEPAGRYLRVGSRGWRGGGGSGAACAPARTAPVVVGPRVVAIGRGRERARVDSVRASLNRANVGGFARCEHTNRRFYSCINPASAQRCETNYGISIPAAGFKVGNAREPSERRWFHAMCAY